MLVIRLFRVGKKNQPSFKIVVTDKRNPPRAGRFTEEVGFYNPVTKEKVLGKERVQYWLSKGAKPSDTIHNFLVKEGILTDKKIPVQKKSKKKAEAAPADSSQAAPIKPSEAKPAEPPVAEKMKEAEPPAAEPAKKEEPKEEPKKEEPKPAEKPVETKTAEEVKEV